MARKKVKLEFILNDAKRRAACKKRKTGLVKMTSEISTLCGIDACAIIYSPDEPFPTVWPSPFGVQVVLDRFGRMSEHERSKHALNQESFLKKSLTKAQEQLSKLKNENRKREMGLFMINCLSTGGTGGNVNLVDLNDLSWMINETLKDIREKRARDQPVQEQTPPPVVAAANNVVDALSSWEETTHVDGNIQGMMMMNDNIDPMQQKQEWFMDPLNGGQNELFSFEYFNNPSNDFGFGPSIF